MPSVPMRITARGGRVVVSDFGETQVADYAQGQVFSGDLEETGLGVIEIIGVAGTGRVDECIGVEHDQRVVAGADQTQGRGGGRR